MTIRLDSVLAPVAEFTGIAQLIALDTGRAVVRDAKSSELSVVGAGQRDARKISHRGSGPGEFQFASRIDVYRDSVWAISSGKVMLIPLDGSAGVTLDPAPNAVVHSPQQRVRLQVLLPDRSMVALKAYDPLEIVIGTVEFRCCPLPSRPGIGFRGGGPESVRTGAILTRRQTRRRDQASLRPAAPFGCPG
jgi:hypothetical protein